MEIIDFQTYYFDENDRFFIHLKPSRSRRPTASRSSKSHFASPISIPKNSGLATKKKMQKTRKTRKTPKKAKKKKVRRYRRRNILYYIMLNNFSRSWNSFTLAWITVWRLLRPRLRENFRRTFWNFAFTFKGVCAFCALFALRIFPFTLALINDFGFWSRFFFAIYVGPD